jgi:hypothetical protein
MKREGIFALLGMLAIGLAFYGCDTTANIANPSKGYFLKYYGEDGDQTGVDVAVNPDGTYLLLGTSQRTNQPAPVMYLVKVDALGTVMWERTLGGVQGTIARDIELANGAVVVVGNSMTAPNNNDIFIEVLDASTGTKIDSMIYGLTATNGVPGSEDVSTVTPLSDGGFIVTGSTTGDIDQRPGGTTSDIDAIHVRFNFNGSKLSLYSPIWRQTHSGGSINVGTKTFQLGPGRFCFFGYSNTPKAGDSTSLNYWAVDLNANGDGQPFAHPGTPGADERLGSVTQVPSSSGSVFYLGGISTSPNSSEPYVSQVRENITTSDTVLEYASFFDKPVSSTDLQLSSLSPLPSNIYHTSTAASAGSGFYLLANEATTKNSNLYLTKVSSSNTSDWNDTPVIYGGSGNDFSGAVSELPDGRLLVVGTMTVGAGAVTKMVLIKVNKDGHFSD